MNSYRCFFAHDDDDDDDVDDDVGDNEDDGGCSDVCGGTGNAANSDAVNDDDGDDDSMKTRSRMLAGDKGEQKETDGLRSEKHTVPLKMICSRQSNQQLSVSHEIPHTPPNVPQMFQSTLSWSAGLASASTLNKQRHECLGQWAHVAEEFENFSIVWREWIEVHSFTWDLFDESKQLLMQQFRFE